ncbi:MAG: hypothetical protein IPL63_09520 [Saprospiraceae bacterium]|nr:hypothetical protein [Saprospiraceae bacterium]MBK6564065.1 hypothetical protein [Saprospiraceae bacterium]MBK8372298.1 hypothetical protein [Saprospiraceae bacterium]MBK8547596.1 hypothetical protein [Saprospiraceae bacterium]MBK8819980.1 hypothetical protein [Saprospiraceae bacterium]
MLQDNITHAPPTNIKAIITGMILVFLIVHIGFHATYIKHFPEFTEFSWIHHIHGALMGSWVILLVLQPVLIYKRRFTVHRFFGKLTYVIAPLIIISMFLVAKQNYQTGILEKASIDVMANQSITWMQLFMFVFFYSLAVYYRKFTYKHMRFIIGTAILMIGPPLNRILFIYFPEIGVANILPIVLYVKTAIIAVLFLSDFVKNKNWTSYLIMLLTFLFSDLVYHARYSDVWQAFGNFVVSNVYK